MSSKKPEFILVTGSNASGKTTLIESNRNLLESAGFKIIIPDDILKYATSHTDASSVIGEHVEEALAEKSNFVLESPFQFKSLIGSIDQITKAGYKMFLYQVFVANLNESVRRVHDRFKEGGRFIDPDEVRANFSANMANVADQYERFDHAYFIDYTGDDGRVLTAELNKGKLVQLHPSQNKYLWELFQQSLKTKKTAKDILLKILANKKISPSKTGRRLGTRLRF